MKKISIFLAALLVGGLLSFSINSNEGTTSKSLSESNYITAEQGTHGPFGRSIKV